MSTKIPVILEGNLTSSPKFGTTNQHQWASFDLAVHERRLNEETKEWEDGETVFHRVSAFGKLATRIHASLGKGDPVVVVGNLEFTKYLDKEQNQREGRQVVASVVGPSLKYTTAVPGTEREVDGPKAKGPTTEAGPSAVSTAAAGEVAF